MGDPGSHERVAQPVIRHGAPFKGRLGTEQAE